MDQDTCNANCCFDTSCAMFQWTNHDENDKPACWRGAIGTNPVDSNGVTWTTMRKQSGGGGGADCNDMPDEASKRSCENMFKTLGIGAGAFATARRGVEKARYPHSAAPRTRGVHCKKFVG